jgi:hypothetical protein
MSTLSIQKSGTATIIIVLGLIGAKARVEANTPPTVGLEVFGAPREVTLAWDPNPEPDVVGYRLHYGTTSGGYSEMVELVDATSATVSVPSGSLYYFAVTAYNSADLESLPSSEIAYEGASSIPSATTLTLRANVGDSDGTIVRVDFYEGENLLGTVSHGPFTFEWSALQSGTHTFTARAYDDGGLTADSSAIEVSVAPRDAWMEWRTANSEALGAETSLSGNRDGDLYDNLLEYALCLDPATGSNDCLAGGNARGGFWLEHSGTDTLDAVFVRPVGSLPDLTYTLEVAAALGNPTNWVAVTTGLTPSTTDNFDGTETVRYADLESIGGAGTEGVDLGAGIGFVRLRVGFNDGATVATSHTEVSGWSELSVQREGESCSVPFAPPEVFSGTVTAGGGNVLDVSGSAGSANQGVAVHLENRPYYIEVISGTYEGHRFEITSATDQMITLDPSAGRNTLDPIPDLTGARFAIRAHLVPDDVIPAADVVDTVTPSNNNDPGLAAQLLFFDNANGWSVFFAYDAGGTIAPQWTSGDDSSLRNVGDSILEGSGDAIMVIEPSVGFFFHPKARAARILMVGSVRRWDFACPLKAGYNIVGSAYPMPQSPNSRNMSLDYFTGSADPGSSDQVQLWRADGDAFGMYEYESHFRALAGRYDFWTTQENSQLPDEGDDAWFAPQRAAFIVSMYGSDKSNAAGVWCWPMPWAP